MAPCSDDWSLVNDAIPGTECRELDFNLAFESLLLTIVPNICFLLFAAVRIWVLSRKSVKIDSSSRSAFLARAKMVCGAIAVLGNLLAIVGVTIGNETWPALGVAGLTLTLPVSVSSLQSIQCIIDPLQICILIQTSLEHYRSLRSSELLSCYLVIVTAFDPARLRTLITIGYLDSKVVLVAGFIVCLSARAMLFILENISKRSIVLEELAEEVLSSISYLDLS